MAAVDAAALRTRRRRLVSGAGWCIAATALPFICDSGFGTLRLLGHSLFFHAPIMALALSAILWRSGRKRPAALPLVAALLLVGIYIDAYHIEPYRLQVTRHTLTSSKLTQPLRLVVLADLQMEELGDYERRALRTVVAQQPDLVLLTGDYIEGHDLRGELNAYLKEIGFGRGVAVGGNIDTPGWTAIFTDLDVTHLRNETIEVGEELAVTGLGLAVSFDAEHINTVVPEKPGRFHIVIGHAPDFAMGLAGRADLDLLTAGHTHGGQVQIPGFGPIITLSEAPRDWAEGRHRVGGATLLVSRGVGMERGRAPRLRFWCAPEILVIDVRPAGP